jgi:hypothetical protein
VYNESIKDDKQRLNNVKTQLENLNFFDIQQRISLLNDISTYEETIKRVKNNIKTDSDRLVKKIHHLMKKDEYLTQFIYFYNINSILYNKTNNTVYKKNYEFAYNLIDEFLHSDYDKYLYTKKYKKRYTDLTSMNSHYYDSILKHKKNEDDHLFHSS